MSREHGAGPGCAAGVRRAPSPRARRGARVRTGGAATQATRALRQQFPAGRACHIKYRAPGRQDTESRRGRAPPAPDEPVAVRRSRYSRDERTGLHIVVPDAVRQKPAAGGIGAALVFASRPLRYSGAGSGRRQPGGGAGTGHWRHHAGAGAVEAGAVPLPGHRAEHAVPARAAAAISRAAVSPRRCRGAGSDSSGFGIRQGRRHRLVSAADDAAVSRGGRFHRRLCLLPAERRILRHVHVLPQSVDRAQQARHRCSARDVLRHGSGDCFGEFSACSGLEIAHALAGGGRAARTARQCRPSPVWHAQRRPKPGCGTDFGKPT